MCQKLQQKICLCSECPLLLNRITGGMNFKSPRYILNWLCYLALPAQLIVTFIDNFRLMRPFIVLRTSRSKITRLYTGYRTSRTCSPSPASTGASPTTWGTAPPRQVRTSSHAILILHYLIEIWHSATKIDETRKIRVKWARTAEGEGLQFCHGIPEGV